MEIAIYINGQAVSVQVSMEVYDYLNKANHKDENLLHEQRRHWDGRGLDAIAAVHPAVLKPRSSIYVARKPRRKLRQCLTPARQHSASAFCCTRWRA